MSEENQLKPQTVFIFFGILVAGALGVLWYVLKMMLIDLLPQVAWAANLLAIPLVVVLFFIIILMIASSMQK